MSNMPADWFVTIDGQESGPYTGAQIQQFAENGQITPTTCVRQGHMSHTVPAADIEGLFSVKITRPDPSQKKKPIDDESPVKFYALIGVAVVAMAGIAYYIANRPVEKPPEVVTKPPPKEDTHQPVAAPPKEAKEELPDWVIREQAEERRLQEEFDRLEEQKRLARIEGRDADAQAAEAEAQRVAAALKEQRITALQAKQLAKQYEMGRRIFVKSFQDCYVRMDSLHQMRDQKLVTPFEEIMVRAGVIMKEHKGRALESRIDKLKDEIKALDIVRKTHVTQHGLIEADIKKALDHATTQAEHNPSFNTLVNLWNEMYSAHQTAALAYSEMGRIYRLCIDVNTSEKAVIDYRDMLTAHQECKQAMGKLGTTVEGVDSATKIAPPVASPQGLTPALPDPTATP